MLSLRLSSSTDRDGDASLIASALNRSVFVLQQEFWCNPSVTQDKRRRRQSDQRLKKRGAVK